jgi:hypothetical protein
VSWYIGAPKCETGPAQKDGLDYRSGPLRLPVPILELAWQEYAAQGHGSQSLERLNERGGFGVIELVYLLADAVERERKKNQA